MHLFCNFGEVGECWLAEKRLEPQKTKIFAYCPVWPPTKIFSTFLIIIAKVESLPTFLCRNFISSVLGLSSMAVWMDATGFPSPGENCFFALKRRHNDVTGARNLLQEMRFCLPDSMMPSLTLQLNSFTSYGWSYLRTTKLWGAWGLRVLMNTAIMWRNLFH